MSQLTLIQANEQFLGITSKSRQEPDWLRDFRIKSLNLYQKLAPELSPLYTKYVDLAGLELESANLQLPEPSSAYANDAVSKLKTDRAITLYQIESKVIQADVPASLQKEGVVFTDIKTAIQRDPELFKRYFLEKAIPPEDDKFGALNNALFTCQKASK
jgi:Fe-S cluster assembly protein SufB